MATTATAARKAENLRRRLVKKFADHPFAPMVSVTVEGGDLVLYVFSDVVPALKVRDWLNPDLGGHDLYRIAAGQVDRAIAAEISREAENAAWLVAAAATAHA